MSVSEAIILAGGKGKRMRSITMDQYPKALTPIQNRTIVEWEIEWLAREGVNHIVLAVGHLAHMVEEKIGDSRATKFGDVSISYSVEKEKLGSGGAFKFASKLIDADRCLVVNGDLLCNSDLKAMINLHGQSDALASMHLVTMRSPYGVVEVKNNFISQFLEKPLLPSVYIHSGIDIIEREIFHRFPDKGQMEETIFVEIANEGKFGAHIAGDDEFWSSIDSEKDFENANEQWPGL
ncbi:MAG: nucleotidyltransferase family protein [Candidatus Kariarchaeaceae archaeon]|jgi:NDP-sugar pyrophosphorylase family protein